MTWPMIAVAILVVLLAVLAAVFTWRKDKVTADETYMAYYEDGIFEAFFGLMLIFFGLMVDAYPAFIGVSFVLLYPFLLSAKQRITKPRVRAEELSSAMAKARRLTMFIVLGLALLLGILVFEITFWNGPAWLVAWLDQYLLMSATLVVAALIASWGYQSGVKRLYIYSGLILAAYTASLWLNFAFPVYVLAVGMIVMLIGLTVTARFIQEHPTLSSV